jgi:vancomycin resistance protein VanJ
MSEVTADPATDSLGAGGGSPKPIGRLRRFVRAFLGAVTFTYLFSLVGLLVALEWWGERHWVLSVLLYAPPVLFLAPLAALTPLCLLFRARLVLWHLAAAALVGFGYMTFRWCSQPPPTERSFTAVTFNEGQSDPKQFASFLETEKPDVILLQDSDGHRIERATPQWPTLARCGEFALFSRFPIRKATLLEHPSWAGQPIAARFEIEVRGEVLVLYNVHLPTPRPQLKRFLNRRIGKQLLSKEERGKRFADYRQWVNQRLNLARELAKVLAAESQPFIVAGDFNTPDHGCVYHLIAGEATDAFAKSGRGWGLTFPGHTRASADWLAPWLRLDYFFVGHGWRPIECRPERGRESEHRAIFARFEPVPKP